MVAKNEPAICFLNSRSRVFFRRVPIFGWIISGQFLQRWPGLQANQPAVLAFHQQEAFVGGSVQAVAPVKKSPHAALSATRAFHARAAASIACSARAVPMKIGATGKALNASPRIQI